MGKKLTIEFVRAEFEKEDWICTSKEYVNSKIPLNCVCPEGHLELIKWSTWQQGYRCSTCAGNKKHTIEFIKEQFEKERWDLLSKEYINNKTPLDCICPEGHVGSIRWNDWQQGCRCLECSGKKKLTIEFIRTEFGKKGWMCVSTKYINVESKLNYVCSKGHYGSITWHNWLKGQRCPICSGKKKHTIKFIKSEFEKEGWECVSTEYINSYSKLDYICPNGHLGSITWGAWQQGNRCSTCAITNKVGSGNPNWKGGISKEPYCQEWTNELKEFVKQRDGYRCMNPCCKSKNPDKLSVHHIEYNKKLCGSKDLITTCGSCNPAANFDRAWHEVWYKAIMYRRYGYTYE